MFRLILASIVLATPVAALHAEQQNSGYDAAVAARRSGDNERAIALLEPLIAANPDNVDARVQLGYAYLGVSHFDAARAQFEAVLQRAPDYVDAREGLSLLARRETKLEPANSVLIVGSSIAVDETASPWREVGAVFAARLSERTTGELGGTWYRRFGLEDVEASGSIVFQSDPNTWLRLGANFAPSADFRPHVGYTAGADFRVVEETDATVLGIDVSWQDYPAQSVTRVIPRVIQFFGNGRMSLTARGDIVHGSDRWLFGGGLRGDYYAGERHQYFVGTARAPDAELGVVTQTTSFYAGGQWPLSETVTLLANASREMRAGPSDRTETRIGLRFGW